MHSARQAFLGVYSGLAQIKAYEVAEASGKLTLDSLMFGYKIGVRVNADILDAQYKLHTARQNLAKARYDTIMNGIRLKFASGILMEEDLVKINQLLH